MGTASPDSADPTHRRPCLILLSLLSLTPSPLSPIRDNTKIIIAISVGLGVFGLICIGIGIWYCMQVGGGGGAPTIACRLDS